jgi:hypothetical protein
VNGSLTVNSGITLTLQEGVEVRFNSGTGFTVNGGGSLNAVGTDTQPIIFTSSSGSPLPGDWRKIVVNK